MGATAALLIAGSGLQATTQWRQGDAARARGEYLGAMEEQNAKLADWQAEDAIARGYETAFKHRGAQRAALAAQGISVGSGSALDVQLDDELIIRNNARLAAWGYRVEAAGFRSRAHLARVGGRIEQWGARATAGSTLLTGGAQTYGAYRTWKGK
ncbi:MAG TPA: hypothetical protein VJZ25_07010 [Gemmatimonadaceae bacterium]|nr:hypothetical protein [Gemmatimonadaceae bacterium]